MTPDNELARLDLAAERREAAAAFHAAHPEYRLNLTEMQRKARAEQEAVLRNDAARGLPSVFGALV